MLRLGSAPAPSALPLHDAAQVRKNCQCRYKKLNCYHAQREHHASKPHRDRTRPNSRIHLERATLVCSSTRGGHRNASGLVSVHFLLRVRPRQSPQCRSLPRCLMPAFARCCSSITPSLKRHMRPLQIHRVCLLPDKLREAETSCGPMSWPSPSLARSRHGTWVRKSSERGVRSAEKPWSTLAGLAHDKGDSSGTERPTTLF